MNPVNDLVSSPRVCSWDPDWYNFENFSFILYSRHADRSSYPLKLLVKKICVICVLLQFKLYMNCIPETQVCSRKSSGTRSENKKRLGYYQTHRTLWKSNKPGCTMIGKVNKNMIIWSTASKKEKKIFTINYYQNYSLFPDRKDHNLSLTKRACIRWLKIWYCLFL